MPAKVGALTGYDGLVKRHALGMAFRSIVLSLVSLVATHAPVWAQAEAAAPVKVVAAGHRLEPNDVIEVKVFQEPDLTTATRVAADGKITFPLIGEVAVSGKTPAEAARVIRDRLEARFLVDPQVSLTVLEPAKRLFTVLGQVQRPGTYRFPDQEALNLVQVIGIAGGYTRLADPARVTVKRQTRGKDNVFQLNAKRMARESASTAFVVQPGDLITVAERPF